MRVSSLTDILTGILLLALPGMAIAGPKHPPAKLHSHASMNHTSVRHKKTTHSPTHHELAAVEMPAGRATQIQAALIKRGYLTGEPSGTWDTQTVAAMQKLQSDNGWQSKVTPDSRALIKLGLGPEPPAPATNQGTAIAQTQLQ